MVSEAQTRFAWGEVAEAAGDPLHAVCWENSWPAVAKEIQPHPVHLFLAIGPAITVADAVKILKGTTARKLFVRFRGLRRRLPTGHLWSPSYFVETAGNVSTDMIRTHIEWSEHMQKRR